MNAVAVDRSTGRLAADAGTIERLKALLAADGARLRSGVLCAPRRPWTPKPQAEALAVKEDLAATPDDLDIEETLIGLMEESAAAARQAFQLAREAAVPGGSVETYGVCAGQAARLTRAFAELIMALARHRSGGARVVIEHYVRRDL